MIGFVSREKCGVRFEALGEGVDRRQYGRVRCERCGHCEENKVHIRASDPEEWVALVRSIFLRHQTTVLNLQYGGWRIVCNPGGLLIKESVVDLTEVKASGGVEMRTR